MANNRLAYGLAKQRGIDTKGMSPKEVWEALDDAGISAARKSSIVPGEGEPTDGFIYGEEELEEEPVYWDISVVTSQINSDPKNASKIINAAIADGRLNTKLFKGAQDKHIPGTQNYKQELAQGREPSILTADANELIKKYAGKGEPVIKKGKWVQQERFKDENYIGVYKNKRFSESYKTQFGRIHYSNKGVHIVPDKER